MSHFIKIYAVCNFSYFHLWYLTSQLASTLPDIFTDMMVHNIKIDKIHLHIYTLLALTRPSYVGKVVLTARLHYHHSNLSIDIV